MKAITPIYHSPFSFFGDFEKEIDGFFGARNNNEYAVTSKQNENEWLAAIEMPGVKSEDLKIEVEDKTLFLRGTKKGYFDHNEETEFSKNIKLPQEVDPEKIQAKLKDGVLLLTLPKVEKAKPKRIEIATH